MGFSLNSLEAEQLKQALQRDSSVSEITLNLNQAFNGANSLHIAKKRPKSETVSHFYCFFFLIFLPSQIPFCSFPR